MFKIVNTLNSDVCQEMLDIAKRAELHEDVSSYARGRQRTWLNMHWDLKDRKFTKENCLRDARMWEVLKKIWPEAEIGLLTYSGEENPVGIKLHRDDSYADYESWGVQLSGRCEFLYMGGYRNFCWDQEVDDEAEQSFELGPGDIFQFNCKNRHSAVPGPGRYAINLWKISKKFRTEYDSVSKPKGQPLF